jgi:hypothetical protein
MVEQLRKSLSVHNLRKGGGQGPRTPLRDFEGVSDGYDIEQDTRYEGRVRVKMKFSSVKVLESSEPYDFPVAVIEIPARMMTTNEAGEEVNPNTATSRWGIFSLSLETLNPNLDLDTLDGHTLRMKWTPDHMLYDGRQQKEVPQEAWEVVSIDGSSQAGAASVPSKSPEEVALEILNGKNIQQFGQAATMNQVVKSDANLISNILNNTWVEAMEAQGKATKNSDGTYKVV